MTGPFQLIGSHIALTVRLLRSYGLSLAALWAGGTLLGLLLTQLAVQIGLVSRIAGMIALVPVILLELLIFVSMFIILRNGLPNIRLDRFLRQAREVRQPAPAPGPEEPDRLFAGALLAVLVPFYAYYAGWGLLRDTLRSYSLTFMDAQMERIDFSGAGIGPSALEVSSTGWVVLAVAVSWAI